MGERSGMKQRLSEIRNDLRLVGNLVLHQPDLGSENPDYDAYWRSKRREGSFGKPGLFQMQRAKRILPRIRPGDTVAEFGCGDAATLLWLKERLPIRAVGLDVSEYALGQAAAMGVETHRLHPGAAEEADLPEADVYLLLEVLEHLPNPEALLRKVLARSRHKVFVSVPNTGYFPYRLRMMMGRFPVQWRVFPGEHLRFWTKADFQWLLGQMGLAGCSRLEAYKGIPGLNRLMPGLFGMGLFCEITP
jgi:SAM-dependent methyltransferase